MVLGIDLGTTFSAGAFIDENGEPQIIINSESQRLTPSVVFFDEGGQIIVGEIAKENEVMYAEDVVAKVKVDMGKRKVIKTIDQIEYTPEVISSLIIKKVVQDASANLGDVIQDVIVTVPAYFMDSQRKATEDAVRLAGVNLLTIIDEPTAAAIYYTYKNKLDKAKILVYDFGGGTFDATLMEIENDKIRIIEKDGLSKAGGTMFDQFLVDYVCQYFEDQHGIDLEEEEYRAEYNELFHKAESCKKQLTVREKASINMKIDGVKEQLEITREFFEAKIEATYNKTENIIKKILRNSGIRTEQIDKILLVGGSSKIPYVSKRLEELFGKAPSREVNPDEAVALGAALYGSIYQKKFKTDKVIFQDVCSHSIGILVFVDEIHQENQIIIPRMSQIPCTKEQIFYTKISGQRQINLSITEGEYKELDYVTLIGEFMIDLPSGLPINTEVTIKIGLDERQLIHLSIAVPAVKLEKEFEMERNANLGEEELKKLQGIMSQKTVF
ncbi:MAG: hypothetical protein K0S47_1947 [Herbinix sp.]|jgi:molecular chaperone DnaK|nr:hypothetical protein [Herbinix sp.]